jgi:hypothetical protein
MLNQIIEHVLLSSLHSFQNIVIPTLSTKKGGAFYELCLVENGILDDR